MLAGAAWGNFDGNVNEPVWTETKAGAIFFFLAVHIASGTLSYWVA